MDGEAEKKKKKKRLTVEVSTQAQASVSAGAQVLPGLEISREVAHASARRVLYTSSPAAAEAGAIRAPGAAPRAPGGGAAPGGPPRPARRWPLKPPNAGACMCGGMCVLFGAIFLGYGIAALVTENIVFRVYVVLSGTAHKVAAICFIVVGAFFLVGSVVACIVI